ncbi:MAG: type II toxin-antitoxin system RelE/ParE family toxin [Saccharofermentans sp.]|nr:type II toxin-antitoxin system RelE/ParE family toxin [Saccharofermentans sp.]
MNYSVKLTATAIQDLREIALWIAGQAKDTNIAKRFVNELREECNKLNSFPDRGALPKDRILLSMGYRFIVFKDYLIFYLTDDEKMVVNVMAIFNAKRDYMRVMRKFI